MKEPAYGYHRENIPRGEFGEASKIVEESLEFMDAVQQNARIMELQELSDLLGAIQGYLENYHCGYSVEDLIVMASITERAFNNGDR